MTIRGSESRVCLLLTCYVMSTDCCKDRTHQVLLRAFREVGMRATNADGESDDVDAF
jgi:hypothetical protein